MLKARKKKVCFRLLLNVVIIGGSMANSMDLFYPIMNETLRRNICPVPAQKLRIVKV